MNCLAWASGLRAKPLLSGVRSHHLSLFRQAVSRSFSTGLSITVSTPSSSIIRHLEELMQFDAAFTTGKFTIAESHFTRAKDIVSSFPDPHLQLELEVRRAKLAQARGLLDQECDAWKSVFDTLKLLCPLTSENAWKIVAISFVSGQNESPVFSLWSESINALILAHIRAHHCTAALALVNEYAPIFVSFGLTLPASDLYFLAGLAHQTRLHNMNVLPVPNTNATTTNDSAALVAIPKTQFKLKLTSVKASTSPPPVSLPPSLADPVDLAAKQAAQRDQLDHLDRVDHFDHHSLARDAPAARAPHPPPPAAPAPHTPTYALDSTSGSPNDDVPLAFADVFHSLTLDSLPPALVAAAADALDAMGAGAGRHWSAAVHEYLRALVQAVAVAQATPESRWTLAACLDAAAQLHCMLAMAAPHHPPLWPYARALLTQGLQAGRACYSGWERVLSPAPSTSPSDHGQAASPAAQSPLLRAPYAPRLAGAALLQRAGLAGSVSALSSLLTLTEQHLPGDTVALSQVLVRLAEAYAPLNPVTAEGLSRTAQGHVERAPPSDAVLRARVDCSLAHARLLSQLTWNGAPRMSEAVRVAASAIRLARQHNVKPTYLRVRVHPRAGGAEVSWATVGSAWAEYAVVFDDVCPAVEAWHLDRFAL